MAISLKRKEYQKAYRLKNKESRSKYMKEYNKIYAKKPNQIDRVKKYWLKNKDSIAEKRKLYAINNPEKIKNRNFEGRLKNYGLTVERYNAMYTEQDGLCLICKGKEILTFKGKIKRMAVDHNHKTGKVRGLLCNDCNLMLGYAKDDISLLISAIEYLNK